MLNHPIARQTLLISLKSWRYIVLVSFLAYLVCMILLLNPHSIGWIALSFAAGFITLFFCWRLWMDEKFFDLLMRNPENATEFDAAIQALWAKNQTPRTLEDRWQGAAKLIKQAWLAVSIQWVSAIIALI